MNGWIEWTWDAFKIAAPLMTGGAAGATLTYFLNQRASRLSQPSLSILINQTDYSISESDEDIGEIRVSYEGIPFDNLILYEIFVTNNSNKTSDDSPFLFIMEKGTQIIDQSSRTLPTDRRPGLTRLSGHECAFEWNPGELKPRDAARLRMLLSPATSVKWHWRGHDNVEVTSPEYASGPAAERQLRYAILWTALYIGAGTIPFLSEALRALLLVASAPFIISYCMRWRTTLRGINSRNVTLKAVHSQVALNFGKGVATVEPAPAVRGGKQDGLQSDT